MLFPNSFQSVIDKDIWVNTKLQELNPNVDLVLVLSPIIMRRDINLNILDRLPFKMIKLHGFLHNWHPSGRLLKSVFQVANKRKVPIMLHTGGCERSDAGNYLNICSLFPNVRVILAHSRPFDQTVEVMMKCSNVWADTSFVPAEKVKLFAKKGLIDRVVFGTDFPVSTFYASEKNLKIWYEKNISKTISTLGSELFKTLSNTNYINFYS
jgi:predicted TIM-barrel fold metal-dependent hydrolase